MKISPLIPIAILALFTGCAHRIADYTLISTKNVDITALGKTTHSSQRVRARDIGHVVFGIPLTVANVKNAVDKAVEKQPGAVALVSSVVYVQNIMFLPLLYSQVNFVVEGDPLIDNTIKKPEPAAKKN